jgi:hypothetical protein
MPRHAESVRLGIQQRIELPRGGRACGLDIGKSRRQGRANIVRQCLAKPVEFSDQGALTRAARLAQNVVNRAPAAFTRHRGTAPNRP